MHESHAFHDALPIFFILSILVICYRYFILQSYIKLKPTPEDITLINVANADVIASKIVTVRSLEIGEGTGSVFLDVSEDFSVTEKDRTSSRRIWNTEICEISGLC